MKIEYKRSLPLIEVTILGPRSSVKYEGLLDTGASWVSVKSKDVDNLKLEYLGEMPIYTAAGFLVLRLYLAKILFLGREFDTPVFPLDIPEQHGFDCLIGMSIQKHFRITFDNKKQILEIE